MHPKDSSLLACETCGNPLSASQKRYCSKACRDTRLADRTYTCETCGASFRPKHKAQRYCGISCKSKATWAIRRGEVPSAQGGVVQFVCAHCGTGFEDIVSAKRQYCSARCHDEGRRTWHIRQCANCGQTFMPTHRKDQPFCSLDCGFAAGGKRGRKRTGWDEPKSCAQCGDTFTPTRQNQQFCSHRCGALFRHAQDLATGKRTERPELTCQHCGELFRVFHSAVKRRPAPPAFCSKPCAYAARRGQFPEHLIRILADRTSTSIEVETYEALEAMGIDFERQRFIGRALVDAYVPETKTVIEVQGDYWHCNPAVYPDGPKTDVQRQKIARDKTRFAYLRGRGYRVIELWELDIRTHGALALLQRLL